MNRTYRLISTLVLTLMFAMLAAGPALAHGETSQEPWLRMTTVAFWNTEFTANGETTPALVASQERIPLNVGDEITLTGTTRILETWPRTLRDPDTGFFSVVSPGPVFIMTRREVNGLPAPQSVFVRKGATYNYEMALRARIPGDYHLHPTLAVRGSGTLIGPGQWFQVGGDRASFTNMIPLASGETVNLENYGLVWREIFSWSTMVLGVIWLLYWIVPKPTVTRLAITSQLSVNDDGGEAVGLITRKDHRAMNLILLATIALLGVGWIYQSITWPDKIPLQVNRYPIEPAQLPPDIIRDVRATNAVYDGRNVTFTMTGNVVGGPVEVSALHLADYTFSVDASNPQDRLVVSEPQISGEGQEFTLTVSAETMDNHLLLPRNSPNTSVAGVVRFDRPGAESNFKTFQQNLRFTVIPE